MRKIDSIKDAGYSLLASVAKKSSSNAESVLLDNIPLLEAAIYGNKKISAVLWDEKNIDDEYAQSLINVLESQKCDVMSASHHLLRRLDISQGNPQCIFLTEVKEQRFNTKSDLSSMNKRFIILLDVMDPMNIGTILRHAEAFGYSVIGVGDTSPFVTRQVMRSSTGSGLRKPFYRFSDDIIELFGMLSNNGYQIITSSAHAVSPLTDFIWSDKHAIVVGNESRGLPIELRHGSSNDICVPMMPGGVHSINVAAASSILMYTGMTKTDKSFKE